MSNFNLPMTFMKLLDDSELIVPQIQRDYAQGRAEEREVRNGFLDALHEALSWPEDDPRLPLNLDFIYGSMEGENSTAFLPLDGQQRLTTLFLLHWYLAWRDGQLAEFQQRMRREGHSRFTYQVRPSSTEFFDEIVKLTPDRAVADLASVKKYLENQPWFFLYWRLDPTIQSAVTMLDAIHERFRASIGRYARLVDEAHPAIAFQQLRLEHFGLSDDLYIKMNARGKPLTSFETFKARFEEHLKTLYSTEQRFMDKGTAIDVPTFFALRMDTRWADFLWNYGRAEGRTLEADGVEGIVDNAMMNLIWALIRISLDPNSPEFVEHTGLLRNRQIGGSFAFFDEHGWLTREFSDNLITLLEAWSAEQETLSLHLPPGNLYFDEKAFFAEAIRAPAALEYPDLLRFAAFVTYLRYNEGAVVLDELHEWMRVVFNLSENSLIERPEQYRTVLAGLRKLLPHSRRIVHDLAGPSFDLTGSGFSPQQVREESLKAKLILAHSNWRDRIDTAEKHPFFRGQIEFVLDFAGAFSSAEKSRVREWSEALHSEIFGQFERYLRLAHLTFDKSGLVREELPGQPYLWQRALLAIGDYLIRAGGRRTFLTNSSYSYDRWKNWKKFLGGDASKRRYLKTLWDRIDGTRELGTQLLAIIQETPIPESWRDAMVRFPQVIDYCSRRETRWENDEIYLLRTSQMNGAHAELFTFVLHQQLTHPEAREQIAPLELQEYRSSWTRAEEPQIQLHVNMPSEQMVFAVESDGGKFWVAAPQSVSGSFSEVEAALVQSLGFTHKDGQFARHVARDEIHSLLRQLARCISSESVPSQNS